MQRVRSLLLTSLVLAGSALAAVTIASPAAEAGGPGRAGFGFHRGAGARAFVGVRSPFFERRMFAIGRRNAFRFGRFERFAPWGLAGWGYPGWGYGWGGLWGGYGPYDPGYANAAPAAEAAAPQPDMGVLVVPTVVGIRNAPEGTVYVIAPPPGPGNSAPPAGQRGGLSERPGPKIIELGRAPNGSAVATEEAAADAGPRIITVSPGNSAPPAGPRGGLSERPGPKIIELGRAPNGSAVATEEAAADAGPRIITVKLR